MKVKVGDIVTPKIRLGKISKIEDEQVIIRYKDQNGDLRYSYLTKQQADLRGKTLDQHVDDSLAILTDIKVDL